MPPTPTIWLEREHEVYQEYKSAWVTTRDCYTGEVIDPDKVTTYLLRKATAEHPRSYEERAALADYTNHFATVVDSLAGMLFGIEGDATRTWTVEGGVEPGIGTPDDTTSLVGRLWRNADGKGTGWLTFFKQLAMELTHSHRVWVLADTDQAGNAIVRMFPALAGTNWLDDGSQVLMQERVDLRTDLHTDTDAGFEDQYLLFTLTGWERWRVTETGGAGRRRTREAALLESGTYSYVDREGNPTLPIFLVELPLNRFVGYSLAKKALAIFNKESERDHLLRVSGFPRLKIVGTDEQYAAIIKSIERGINTMQDDPSVTKTHEYIAPSSDPATVMTDVLKRKVEEFYVTAFREFGDAARERTATEVRAQVSAGIGAFLQLLKSAVDDAENQAFGLVAQTQYPQEPDRWWTAHVERSEDFLPPDLNLVIDRLRTRYFGDTNQIPVGRTGLQDVVRQVAEWDGVAISEAEVKAAVDIDTLMKLQPIFEKLPVPAEVRVDMTLDMLVSLGRVDPEAAVKMDDGTMVKAIDVLRNEMLALAEAQDREKVLLTEQLAGAPGGRNAPPEEEEPAPADAEDEDEDA